MSCWKIPKLKPEVRQTKVLKHNHSPPILLNKLPFFYCLSFFPSIFYQLWPFLLPDSLPLLSLPFKLLCLVRFSGLVVARDSWAVLCFDGPHSQTADLGGWQEDRGGESGTQPGFLCP